MYKTIDQFKHIRPKKEITGLTHWEVVTHFQDCPHHPSLSFHSSSPPASDSDQTTFPQGRVYQETNLTSCLVED
jgi:hypothetical protein